MSAAEQRAWFEGTPAGQLARAFGIDSFAIDRPAVEQRIEETRQVYRERFGRELTAREVEVTRQTAELRSAPVAAVRDIPQSVPELVQRVNAATVNAGWSYTPQFRGPRSGVAILQSDGSYRGDPVVARAAQEADEAKRRQLEAEYGAWRSGPLVLRTIAGPS